MAEELLGVGFEIHGGGNDLAFPHHENEAAQTRMGRGAELAQIWMHNGMLQLQGGTMGKSLGNAIRLHEVVERGRPRRADHALRRARTTASRWTSTTSAWPRPRARVARIRDAARQLADGASPDDMRAHRDAFFAALAEDFNTRARSARCSSGSARPTAATSPSGARTSSRCSTVLGLENLAEAGDEAGAEELELLERRQAARAAKDWAAADAIRDELAARGWTVRDGPDGAELVRSAP